MSVVARHAAFPASPRGVAALDQRRHRIAARSSRGLARPIRAVARPSRITEESAPATTRREAAVSAAFALAALVAGPAEATPPRQSFDVPPDAFKPLPGTNPPIMYYDIKGGGSTEGGARPGQRVAVHFDVKFRRITIATSRQGAGVTGGVPYGFQVGAPAGTPGGPFIKAFNEGIKGMGPGQFRRMIVPPEYAYGNQQVQEIPPNSTLTVDLELLSVAARA
mmetsp:Transcript_2795/g.10983  ORF Transcript_2795/g.10983 Transcript_2795/m.10983 type:complete len:222 (-) Transcript_2795:86-751(-)